MVPKLPLRQRKLESTPGLIHNFKQIVPNIRKRQRCSRCSVLRIRDSGSGAFFDTGIRDEFLPDPGSQTHISDNLVTLISVKYLHSLAPIFCGLFKTKIIINFVKFKAAKKVEQKIFPFFQCCGSGMFISDSGSDFFHPGSDFFHPGSASSILTKKWFLSSRKYDLRFSSRIRILKFYPSRIPYPGSRGQKGTGFRLRSTVFFGSYWTDPG